MSVFINGSQNPSKCKIQAIPRFWRNERKIDVTALRGALGVISMRRLSSMSGALEKYFSSTSLNIFFFLSDFFCLLALWMECLKCSHNGRGTTVTHSAAPRVPSFCYYLILTSSVIYHETEARQHGIYWYLLITWQNESCTLLIGPCLWSITNISPFLSSKTGRFHVSVDHRRRQNVVITSETHSAAHREPLLCFEHILTSPFTYCYWTGNTSHLCCLLIDTSTEMVSLCINLFVNW